jgi:hypothetical protein
MIDDAARRALFIDIHRDIHDVATKTASCIPDAVDKLIYPPNAEFTRAELSALRKLQLAAAARSALAKLVAAACSTVMFQFFTLLDGVADPSTGDFDPWLGASLAPKPEEDEPMLHDEFHESYWSYKATTAKKRRRKSSS